ncbi:hypothetical protein MPSEU_000565500 [Mayamaea pseudoterrestris]|nr:hypothetical protein MPSEU_000565500 [Mayamaea pseudoterrestris]
MILRWTVRIPSSVQDESATNPPNIPINIHVNATSTTQSIGLALSTELVDPGIDLPPAPWPSNDATWLQSILQALQWLPPPLLPPPFCFEITPEAAAYNLSILQANDMDLRHLLFSNKDLPTCPGSNFRPVELLDPIFLGHPNWPRVRSTLTTGVAFPLDPLEEKTRIEELNAMVDYGNHKSAKTERHAVLDTLKEETAKGWHLPLPLDALHLIPNVSVAPFGYVKQLKLQADGSRKEAGRITHDQTFCRLHDGTSVNKRVRKADLPPVFYGFALQRLLHRIIATRDKYKDLPIYLPKYDWKSAYKNCHFGLETLVQSATTTKGITIDSTLALFALRMTFGGSPCPTVFSDLSELVTDAANQLVRDGNWHPATIQSRFIANISVEPIVYPTPSTPFATSRPMAVGAMIPVDGSPCFDVFLDDHLGVIVHTSNDALIRGAHAIPLLLDVLGRPERADEPLPRNALIAVSKLIAEGCLTEIQVVLGWEIDTRTLIIRLPQDKYRLYTEDIRALLTKEGHVVPLAILNTLYGRLVHVSVVVKAMSHCLGRIHSAKQRAEGAKYKRARLSRAERRDLVACLELLATAHAGVDINTIVARLADAFILTDACMYQVGGYDLDGRGWRWRVPKGAQPQHINFYEFLGFVVGIWLAAFEGRLNPGDCVLAIGDNTTAAAWLRRSNFSDETASPQTLLLARLLSAVCLEYGICCNSQWRMGLDNVVPDLISRTGLLSRGSPTEQDFVRSLLLDAADNEFLGVTRATHAREDMAWDRWIQFSERAGFSTNPFLLEVASHQRLLLFLAFVQSVRNGNYSSPRNGNPFLVAGSVQSTINGVAKAFKAAGHPDPRKNEGGDTFLVLERLYKGYKNLDPSTRHQMALPMSLMRKLIMERSDNPAYSHFQLLVGLAVFFAMRSCEYLCIQKGDKVERRTLPIRACDITFWKDGKKLPHNSSSLHFADSVSIIFRFQKNQWRGNGALRHYFSCPCALLLVR